MTASNEGVRGREQRMVGWRLRGTFTPTIGDRMGAARAP
jgi:hypothetical protein